MTWKYFLALLFLALFCIITPVSSLNFAAPTIKVIEEKVVFSFVGEDAKVVIPIESDSIIQKSVSVYVELINPENEVIASNTSYETLAIGSRSVSLSLFPSIDKNIKTSPYFFWYRLRYIIISTLPSNKEKVFYQGILSVSDIWKDAFELNIVANQFTVDGSLYPVRVLALNPISKKPVTGVNIEAKIKIDRDNEEEQIIKASAKTNQEGQALFQFDLSKSLNTSSLALEISGELNGCIQEMSRNIGFNESASIIINTDKPLYQPNQTLHIRLLSFDAARHAIVNEPISLEITDPERTKVFSAKLKTSRFGIANTDWNIPSNIRLGDYDIEVDLHSQKHNSRTKTQVKISRYDLPTFVVSAKTEQPYYLSEQSHAQVEVKADYLFGKPVTSGSVKIVSQSNRYWNYREQKYNSTEEVLYQGKLSAEGKVLATIDFSKLPNISYLNCFSYPYQDLELAAYVTDDSSNRTEQKRFFLRVSKNDIHLYVIDYKSNHYNFPNQFYLSATYADGSPAECNISLFEEISYSKNPCEPSGEPFLKVKTNRYGIAKISNFTFTKLEDKANEGFRGVTFSATDKSMHKGLLKYSFRQYPNNITISTNKAVYRFGEALQVNISSNNISTDLIVDIAQGDKILDSRSIKLEKGNTSFTVPYNTEFKGIVKILGRATIKTENRYYADYYGDSCSVLYPVNENLALGIKLNKETYKPGEEVKAAFKVKNSLGIPTESALGVVVFDKAVEERFRTEQDFGSNSYYQTYNQLSNYKSSIANIDLKEINRLALSQPLSADLQLVAEVLLNEKVEFFNNEIRNKFSFGYQYLFLPKIKTTLKPIEEKLNSQYIKLSSYPKNETSFRTLLEEQTSYFDQLKDPWGSAYSIDFSSNGDMDILQIVCNGVDKKLKTEDDFVVLEMQWPYFRPYGQILGKAVSSYFDQTGICISDIDTLKREALKYGLNLDLLLDYKGSPYTFYFEPSTTNFYIKVYGYAPYNYYPYKNSLDNNYYNQLVWTIKLDYFSKTHLLIQKSLDSYLKDFGSFPQNKDEFDQAMQQANINFSSLKDFWGESYYVQFEVKDVFTSKNIIENLSLQKNTVWEKAFIVKILSCGRDKIAKTYDDFIVATFTNIVPLLKEKPKSSENANNSFFTNVKYSYQSGAIRGVVLDETGAVIVGATIKVTNKSTDVTSECTTNEQGEYVIKQLLPGLYQVKVSADGFNPFSIDIEVTLSAVVVFNITLSIGSTSDIVEVRSDEIAVERSSQMSATFDARRVMELPTNSRNVLNFALASTQQNQMATPRLREDFPETLLWYPELETTSDGQASLKFKLADNITTWKMAVIGSTINGEITTIDTEFQAFQPFFAELDPPKSLTEGDEISLPITLRNYLEHSQTVTMAIAAQPWLTALSPLKRTVKVPSGSFSQEIFDFRADTPITKGDQLVSVVGKETSDAIKKSVDVFPYGEEVSQSTTKIVNNASTNFEVNLPTNALRNNQNIELRLYPNLLSHVVESIEAILKRPYGCGEQTISSTYPSLLMLKYLKQNNLHMPELETKAQEYLQIGYERLLNYRGANGGFTYWGRGEENAALTVYALGFLTDAKDFINVDSNVINSASYWILKRQRADGSWMSEYYYQNEDKERSAQLTAFTLMVLARIDNNQNTEVAQKLKLAIDYLENVVNPPNVNAQKQNEQSLDNSYLLACYAQAAFKLGYKEQANIAINKLCKLAIPQKGASYWELKGYTPFYGWGITGNIETTALVAQALIEAAKSNNQIPNLENLINQALMYLLQNKDRYGVWYSTQTTVHVINAIVAVLSQNASLGQSSNQPTEIYVNGQLVKSITLSNINGPRNQINIDLSKFATTSHVQVQIHNGQGSAQVIYTYYLPWSIQDNSTNSKMDLSVNFDKNQAIVGEEISCQVIAKRKGSNTYGYGMMLAEIGLPPGADVDRASLKTAIEETGYSINHYDILPDRLILYLWPYSGEIKFSFKFRERFAVKAMSCRSTIYDYYNPEAKLTVAPTKFIILPKEK